MNCGNPRRVGRRALPREQPCPREQERPPCTPTPPPASSPRALADELQQPLLINRVPRPRPTRHDQRVQRRAIVEDMIGDDPQPRRYIAPHGPPGSCRFTAIVTAPAK